MNIPKWLIPYLAASDVLAQLVEWLSDGKSDEYIAKEWQQNPDAIHALRCRWSLFRENECPNCGDKNYLNSICLNKRCFSNWNK